ncbi:uncharacterized protein LOC124204672 isoform X2 [Daphnia pulex]|uniref:uncharacterized protein LOC124204672 isoform X2 n=1 Tax=Daphnia pulex TaxID=6669 RepID=UPI001EDD04EB|nr:uncharacterized protein LOC124204672 isoform X2 [Daphnia pulex]
MNLFKKQFENVFRDRHLSKNDEECGEIKSIELLSQPLPNLAKQSKSSPEPYAKSLDNIGNNQSTTKQAHERHSMGKPVLSVLSDPVIGPCSSATNQHSTQDAIMEENARMRKAINDAVLALTRKIHAPSEQTENVFLMFNMLKESERKLIKQRRDLEAMAIKMRTRESQWSAERLAFEEKEQVSKQMILTLQEENYKLRKSLCLDTSQLD